jgi:predicted secreted hydrolase
MLGLFAHGALAGALPYAHAAPANVADRYAPVTPERKLEFPQDFGAHPRFRTEWWYITGWVRSAARDIGVQITFFRSRTGHDDRNPSRFAPHQLILAHAAIAVDGETRLRHDQRAARAGFGLALARERDTGVRLDGWQLVRGGDDRYHASIDARDFALELSFTPPGPPFPQGRDGYSRKGPRPPQASYYYSRPQMAVDGSVLIDRAAQTAAPVRGTAWLDHEWSSELLDPRATGWDWVGLNFDDGTALMAFRIRTRDGGELWSHARWIGAPDDAPAPRFEALRQWRSLRSGASYPVAMRVTVGERSFELRPMFDDQELDTRASTGTLYWEGAVRVLEREREVGRGYLELTGYAGAVRL